MPKGIYIKSEEHKRKLSEVMKGKSWNHNQLSCLCCVCKAKRGEYKGKNNPASRPEVREKIADALKGKPKTEKHKKAMRGISHGLKGKTYEERCGIEIARRMREERRRPMKEMRASHPHPRGMLGKTQSEEWRKNHSQMMSLENHPNWKGGKSYEPYTLEFSKELKLKIRVRDNFTCQFCGIKENGRAHDVHHINYDKKNCNELNLITLCNRCNITANFYREEWELCFVTLLELRGV